MPRRKSKDEFSAQLFEVNPNIELIGDYVNGETTSEFRCKRCGRIFTTAPRRALRGVGCQHCDRQRFRRSHNDFVDEMKSINPYIEIISEYKNHQTKVKCRCLVDDHIWYALPQSLLKGHGCPKCSAAEAAKRLTLTQDEFMDRFNKFGDSNVKIIGKYDGYEVPILCSCKVCGNTWETKACNLLKSKGGTGCPNFRNHPGYISVTCKTLDKFISEMQNVNPDIKVVGEYINNKTPIEVECIKCQEKWCATPHSLLSGSSCPYCCTRKSHGEVIISSILSELKVNYKFQHIFPECRHIRALPFDFYLPDHNACIEFDGAQHYRPVNFGGCSDEVAEENFISACKRDSIKNKFCEENDIILIRIPYYDLTNAKNMIISKISA